MSIMSQLKKGRYKDGQKVHEKVFISHLETSLVIIKMQIKTIMTHFIPTRMRKKKERI